MTTAPIGPLRVTSLGRGDAYSISTRGGADGVTTGGDGAATGGGWLRSPHES